MDRRLVGQLGWHQIIVLFRLIAGNLISHRQMIQFTVPCSHIRIHHTLHTCVFVYRHLSEYPRSRSSATNSSYCKHQHSSFSHLPSYICAGASQELSGTCLGRVPCRSAVLASLTEQKPQLLEPGAERIFGRHCFESDWLCVGIN